MSNFSELNNVIDGIVGRKVLVTGPQRSGTTIAAKMIAEEFNLHYIDEEEIKIDDIQLFYSANRGRTSYVLQAPGLAFIAHRLPVDVVVYMMRDIADIKKSEKRIDWAKDWNNSEANKYFMNNMAASAVKYYGWSEFQKPYMDKHNKQYFEIDYESLKEHPLWIDKVNRINFKARQTK